MEFEKLKFKPKFWKEELKHFRQWYIAQEFFDNWYWISVIYGYWAYGNTEKPYEIAVLSWNKNEWNLCYDTKITSSVIWYLTKEEVEEYIKEIKEL